MKSAYELAMERLAKAEPARTPTPAQKARLAEINTVQQARLAERETFLHGLIARAAAEGNLAEEAELRHQLKRDAETIREEWEAKKEAVWREVK
jgi:hypothetical protein